VANVKAKKIIPKCSSFEKKEIHSNPQKSHYPDNEFILIDFENFDSYFKSGEQTLDLIEKLEKSLLHIEHLELNAGSKYENIRSFYLNKWFRDSLNDVSKFSNLLACLRYF